VRLADYPYVLVRFRCDLCKRSGQSRLARLADKFGCESTLDSVLERMTRDCPWRKDGAFSNSGCGIYCFDLPPKVPPDLPPGMLKLRVAKRGE
jgi:hypothetical protein